MLSIRSQPEVVSISDISCSKNYVLVTVSASEAVPDIVDVFVEVTTSIGKFDGIASFRGGRTQESALVLAYPAIPDDERDIVVRITGIDRWTCFDEMFPITTERPTYEWV